MEISEAHCTHLSPIYGSLNTFVPRLFAFLFHLNYPAFSFFSFGWIDNLKGSPSLMLTKGRFHCSFFTSLPYLRLLLFLCRHESCIRRLFGKGEPERPVQRSPVVVGVFVVFVVATRPATILVSRRRGRGVVSISPWPTRRLVAGKEKQAGVFEP